MSIYSDIGGRPAVDAAVNDFYQRVLADPSLAPYFEGIEIDRLKRHQRAFIGAALGGPVVYAGRDMATAHAGLDITTEAFDAVVQHLAATLTSLGVPGDTIGQIAGALLPLKDDIVTAGSAVTAPVPLVQPVEEPEAVAGSRWSRFRSSVAG